MCPLSLLSAFLIPFLSPPCSLWRSSCSEPLLHHQGYSSSGFQPPIVHKDPKPHPQIPPFHQVSDSHLHLFTEHFLQRTHLLPSHISFHDLSSCLKALPKLPIAYKSPPPPISQGREGYFQIFQEINWQACFGSEDNYWSCERTQSFIKKAAAVGAILRIPQYSGFSSYHINHLLLKIPVPWLLNQPLI